jgi:hypothetical protein
MKNALEVFEDNVPDALLGIMDDQVYGIKIKRVVEIAMKQYAKEVLADYDNWKAHKTPDLVKEYINERNL